MRLVHARGRIYTRVIAICLRGSWRRLRLIYRAICNFRHLCKTPTGVRERQQMAGPHRTGRPQERERANKQQRARGRMKVSSSKTTASGMRVFYRRGSWAPAGRRHHARSADVNAPGARQGHSGSLTGTLNRKVPGSSGVPNSPRSDSHQHRDVLLSPLHRIALRDPNGLILCRCLRRGATIVRELQTAWLSLLSGCAQAPCSFPRVPLV